MTTGIVLHSGLPAPDPPGIAVAIATLRIADGNERTLSNTRFAPTITFIDWDESKRLANLRKHGLDFVDADAVLENPFRLDVEVLRNKEWRTQSFAYVFNALAVLTVIHTGNGDRIIRFRRASREEREVYHEWLENEFKE